MCGRYSLFISPDDIEERFGGMFTFEFEPRYNAAPGQQLPVIRDDSRASITQSRWGFVPSWADEASTNLINARSETVEEKPAFRDAYRNRRCLVPVDGFYEWATAGDGHGSKQPYRITRTDEQPFALAGLWETWTPPSPETQAQTQIQTGLDDFSAGGSVGDPDPDPESDPEQLVTFTILTREPNDTVSEYHDRMAVILSEAEETAWLDGVGVDALEPTPADALRGYPVSTAVNDPSNDSPVVVEEIDPAG